MGQILTLAHGRMLAVLCNGDNDLSAESPAQLLVLRRPLFLRWSDPAGDGGRRGIGPDARIGSKQVRGVVMMGEQQMLMRPPTRLYGDTVQTREIIWERVWSPVEGGGSS